MRLWFNVNLTDILSNGYNGNSYHIGCGFVVLAIGIVIAVAGCFIDIVKPFKKDLHVDAKYLSNSLNQSLTSKMYYYRDNCKNSCDYCSNDRKEFFSGYYKYDTNNDTCDE